MESEKCPVCGIAPKPEIGNTLDPRPYWRCGCEVCNSGGRVPYPVQPGLGYTRKEALADWRASVRAWQHREAQRRKFEARNGR